jgi:hypothetical protein
VLNHLAFLAQNKPPPPNEPENLIAKFIADVIFAVVDKVIVPIVLWLVKLLESALYWLFDILYALLIIVLMIIAFVFVYGSSYLSMPIAIFALLLMIIMKAGWLFEWSPLKGATIVTAVAALGSLGFLSYVVTYPEISASFENLYGSIPPVPMVQDGMSTTDRMYIQMLGAPLRQLKMWLMMSFKDGIIFFIASLLLLTFQKLSREAGSKIMGFFTGLLGAVLFALVIASDQLLEMFRNNHFAMMLSAIYDTITSETHASVELFKVISNSSEYPSFTTWLDHEVVKTGGSIYKMISIYPKLFFVFLVANVIRPAFDG